ncbi:unnamed protein product, partial [Rotaria sp. Silwood1]
MLNREQSTTEINGTFLFSQLLIHALLHMKSLSTDINEFVTECAKKYAGQFKFKQVQEFYNSYKSDKPILEYTKTSFLHELINKTLRVQNIDMMFLLRFHIRDIQQQLAQHQCQSPVRVYREQLMSTQEVERLLSSVDQLISTNTILSTSLERMIAEFFFSDQLPPPDFEIILFIIDADPNAASDVTPFVNITQCSQFGDAKQEVLFMLGSIFCLTNIHQEGDHMWVASMTLCSDGVHELRNLFETLKDEVEGETKNNYRCALNYQHIALAIRSQCLPSNHPDIAQSHTDIAAIHFDLGEYSLAIDHNQAALQIESKTLPSNHLSLATSYDYLAVTYDHVGDRETAKEYFLKAQFINENNALFAQQNPYQTISYQCPICKHHLTESSIGQMLHYLHLLLDIQNCKKIYSFSINCKQITFFYVEKESKSNLYNYYKSQDLDMFNNYSETSLPVDMIITKEEWKNKYLNEVIWKIFTNFLTMSNNFYEYATLNIDPRDDLFDCRYMIRKKLGIGLTTMVYLLEKKEDNYLIEDSPHYAMKILKENDYSEYFLNEIKITEKLTQFDNSNKFYLFFQDILSPLSSGKYLVYEKELQCIDSLALIQSKQFIDITHYLYDCHIIHCDVRPKNLMLDRDTNHIKLIDFGFAIAYDEDDDRSTVDIMDPVMYAN